MIDAVLQIDVANNVVVDEAAVYNVVVFVVSVDAVCVDVFVWFSVLVVVVFGKQEGHMIFDGDEDEDDDDDDDAGDDDHHHHEHEHVDADVDGDVHDY